MNIMRKIVRSQLVVGFLSFVFFWEIIYLVIQTHTIPSPVGAFVYLFTIIDELLLHSLGSIGGVVAAMSVSLVIGIPLGIFLGMSKLFNRLFSPFLYYIYPIPKVAFTSVYDFIRSWECVEDYVDHLDYCVSNDFVCP